MDETVATIERIVRSPHRVRILRQLSLEPTTFEGLNGDLAAASRTTKRALELLKAEGWVSESASEYRLTPVGTVFANCVLSCLNEAETILTLKPFLEQISPNQEYIDVELLLESNIEVVTQQLGTPYAPIERTIELLSSATTIRTLAPVIASVYADQYYRLITASGTNATTVLTPEVADYIRTESTTEMNHVLDTGNVEAFVCENDLPFGLLIVDDSVAMGAYDEYGTMRVLLVSDSVTVREWAMSTFERYKENSTSFEL